MVGENHRIDFRKRELSGSSREQKDKSVLSWWKLRYEALRFHPFSIVVPLPPLSRVEMNAKAALDSSGKGTGVVLSLFT
jgi:hypothetical protein